MRSDWIVTLLLLGAFVSFAAAIVVFSDYDGMTRHGDGKCYTIEVWMGKLYRPKEVPCR